MDNLDYFLIFAVVNHHEHDKAKDNQSNLPDGAH